MIVGGGAGFRRGISQFLVRNWAIILTVVLVEELLIIVSTFTDVLQTDVFSAGAVGVFTTVVGIFIVFRFNEAYQRWWEARILWGALVNDSRSFARQVNTLLTPKRVPALRDEAEAEAFQGELVYRQIAFCNALRLSLRRQTHWEELAPFLSDEELEGLQRYANKPTQLNRRQADRLTEVVGATSAEQLILLELGTTLNRLYDVQGGCERIKNTAFPDEVRLISRLLIWLTAIAIPVAFLNPTTNEVTVAETLGAVVIVLSFMVVEQLGAALKNPFENAANDTPMTALCRTIEIDLRQQLGETNPPPPIEPVEGILP